MTKVLIVVGLIAVVVLVFLKFYNKTKAAKNGEDKVVNLPLDDKMFERYKDTAQEELSYLIKFMGEHEKGDTFFRYAVKTNFSENGNNEHMWVQVYEYKENYFTGTVSNEPSRMQQVKYGDTVKVHRRDVEDWILQDFWTNTEVGGFSQDYLRNKAD